MKEVRRSSKRCTEGETPLASPVVEPSRQSFSVVVLGDFNPSIFQPLWFSANGLMPEEETKAANVLVIQKQLALFSMGSMQVQVDGSRLGLTTVESPQGPILRDLAIGTLSVLEHTPLRAIGLNLDTLFVMESDAAWQALGDRMVPKTDWSQVFEQPEMRQVEVEGKRPDCRADRVRVRVQPSENRSVFLAVNQHYQLETDQRADVRDRHKEAIRVLREDWPSFLSYGRDAAFRLLHFGPNG